MQHTIFKQCCCSSVKSSFADVQGLAINCVLCILHSCFPFSWYVWQGWIWEKEFPRTSTDYCMWKSTTELVAGAWICFSLSTNSSWEVRTVKQIFKRLLYITSQECQNLDSNQSKPQTHARYVWNQPQMEFSPYYVATPQRLLISSVPVTKIEHPPHTPAPTFYAAIISYNTTLAYILPDKDVWVLFIAHQYMHWGLPVIWLKYTATQKPAS